MIASASQGHADAALDLLLPSLSSGPVDPQTQQPALDCDLTTDCTEAFDEEIRASRPGRVTLASGPVGHGVETTGGLVGRGLLSCGANAPVELPFSGEASYSFCADDGAAHCPFYLGGLQVAADVAQTTVDLTCLDGTSQSVSLGQLGLELSQPAFGVSYRGDKVSFGPGALVSNMDIELDGASYRLRRPNARTVEWSTSASGLERSYIELAVRVPCNSSIATLSLALALEQEQVAASAPLAEITMPTTVACGASATLSGTFSDQDGDLESVRWYVDGVRIAAATTSITISEGHEVRAVAIDTRGAATTDVVHVGCN